MLTGVVAPLGLAVLACLAVWPAFGAPVNWTPDGLYYQARVLEIRGTGHDAALTADVRRADLREAAGERPAEHGQPRVGEVQRALLRAARRRAARWRGAVPARRRPLAALSLARRLRRVDPRALRPLAPPLQACDRGGGGRGRRSSCPRSSTIPRIPLTDSWGLALEIVAFAAALLALDRGRRWLLLWIGAIALLAFTRDSTWIPVLAAGWCALRYRTRVPVALFVTGVVAALPALLVFTTPVRDLLALLVNNSEPSERHLVVVHREPLPPRASSSSSARTSASSAAASGTPRSTSSGALSRWCCSCGGDGSQSRLAHFDDRRRRGRVRLRPRGAGLQRLPARARLRADGRLRAGARDRACRRSVGERGGALDASPCASPCDPAFLTRCDVPDAMRRGKPSRLRVEPRRTARSGLDLRSLSAGARDGITEGSTGADRRPARPCGQQLTHTQRLWRMAPVVAAPALATCARRRRARPARRLERRGDRDARPGRAVERAGRVAARRGAHVARADGQVFMLDGFDAGAELGAPLGSDYGQPSSASRTAEPLLRRATSSCRTAAR